MASRGRFAVPTIFLVIIFSFSINSIITRYLVSGNLVGPFPLTIIRFVSGFVTLQLMITGFSGRFKKTKARARDLAGALFLGLYAFAISFGYFFIPAGAGALVFYGMVVITMSSYSVARDGEKLTLRLLIGIVLGFLGIVILTFGGIGAISVQGVALMALTGASWGLYSVHGRKSDSSFGYTYNSFLLFGIVGSVLALASASLTGTQQWTGISIPSLALVLYMGMISTALSYVVWNSVLRRVTASLGGLVQLLVPVLTALMGVFFLSEGISLALVVGGVLILSGIYVNGSRGAQPKSAGNLVAVALVSQNASEALEDEGSQTVEKRREI
ncbi:MAG: DMT family transporter [Thaumarchaeota archaeon]|nr:DMT family transporter [Nitrososphaerota archaeon]